MSSAIHHTADPWRQALLNDLLTRSSTSKPVPLTQVETQVFGYLVTRALEITGAQIESLAEAAHMYVLQHLAHWVKCLCFLPFSWIEYLEKSAKGNECCLRHVSGRRASSAALETASELRTCNLESCKVLFKCLFPFALFPTFHFYLSPMYNCSNVLIQIHLILLVLKNCAGWALALVYDIQLMVMDCSLLLWM